MLALELATDACSLRRPPAGRQRDNKDQSEVGVEQHRRHFQSERALSKFEGARV
jgi:hypothetical protein